VNMSRERAVAEAFADLSDTLVADFDVLELLHRLAGRCVDLTGVQAAVVMLADHRGGLRVMASSAEETGLLELFEVAADGGPCADSYTAGHPVAGLDLGVGDPARAAGFRSVHATPVRLRDDVIGVLGLFSSTLGALSDADVRTARALANVAGLALVQHRAVEYRQLLAEQLQRSLVSRVIVEQAKGVLAELLGLDMAAAFTELGRYARRTGRPFSEVAADIVTGDYPPDPPEPDPGHSRVLLICRFDGLGLRHLRAEIRRAATRHGLTASQLAAFTLAVHEAAVNAVEHGGGDGQLILWRYGGSLYAEIGDHGPGLPPGYQLPGGEVSPQPEAPRGLWIVNRICAGVDLQSGPAGTHLLMRFPLAANFSGWPAVAPRPRAGGAAPDGTTR
jgi:anti-sigma regulatory factor (Ser/Thr protein kinase)